MAWKHNGPPRTDLDASSAPTASDNASLGYSVGSTKVYDGTVYTLVRFDGDDAVWREQFVATEDGLVPPSRTAQIDGVPRTYGLPEESYQVGVGDVAAGVERRTKIAVAPPLDITAADDEGDGGGAVVIQCEHDGTLYGLDSSNQLHTSTDGTTWSIAGLDDQSLTLVRVDPQSGNLLGWSAADGVVYVSTDGGASWTAAINAFGGDSPALSTANAEFAAFSQLVRLGDYLFWGEYGTAAGGTTETEIGNIIWRSGDNGLTWESVYDQREDASVAFRHIHTMCAHAATGRVLAFAGDNVDHRVVLVSADNGNTWTTLTTYGNTYLQPIQALDVGDPTRVMVGADGTIQIGTIDVLTGEATAVYQGFSRESAQTQYVHALFQSDSGTIYASQWTGYHTGTPDSRACMLAANSIDGPWAVVADWGTAQGGLYVMTELAGTIHGDLYGTSRYHVSWPDIEVTNRTARLLDDGMANLWSESMADGTEEGAVFGLPSWGTNPTVEQNVDATGLPGWKCFRITTAGDTAWADTDTTSRMAINGAGRISGLTAGDEYQGSFWVRADAPMRMVVICSTDGGAIITGSSREYWIDTTWRRIELPVVTIPAGKDEFGIIWYIDDGPFSRSVEITALQCVAGVAGTWHTGGAAARAAATYEAPLWMPSSGWSHAIGIAPLSSGYSLSGLDTGEEVVLGTWYGSDRANDYAKLILQPSSADSMALILRSTTDGGTTDIDTTLTAPWEAHAGGGMIAVVQFNGSDNKFTVALSAPGSTQWESATAATATAGFASVNGSVIQGGSGCLAGWYTDLAYGAGVVPEADLWDWIADSITP